VSKKHVLFIVENNSVPFDLRVWNEARAAREFGYDVTVICPSDARKKDSRSMIDGIRILRHPQVPEGSGKALLILEYLNATFWELLLSFRVFAKHPFHVIHGANPPDHVFLVAAPFKLFGVKYLFDHHDIAPENYVAKFGKRGLLHKLLLLMERLTFKSSDLVISTNESYKKIAMGRGGKRSEEIFVVRNGPDIERMPETLPDPKLREGFRFLVGYVGVLGQQEGIDNLLQAVDHIVRERKRTDIKFIIVGSGPHLKSLIKQSRDLGLEAYVQFTGYVPDRVLHAVLASADVCVNPEFGNEFTDKSTMIKIMEYMMFAKPIVQFHTTEGEVSAGDSAVYIRENSVPRFASAILDLLDNPEQRAKMGAWGRKRIEERLGWAKQKQQLADAYRTILKA
jgi:glycosyltransferase involved in cell wall biosynthesis